ncbi:MAG: hypothetical protein IJU44_10550 [Kiritimatiellae bacterium]|nr:hypothetical protein [Kiritimatiellia bacterium]
MFVLLAIVTTLLNWIFPIPIWGKVIVAVLKFIVPDPIPFIDEIVAVLGIFRKMSKD